MTENLYLKRDTHLSVSNEPSVILGMLVVIQQAFHKDA